MKNTRLIFLFALIVASSCQEKNEGFKKHKENFYSQLLEFDDSNKSISDSCFIQFNWMIISNKDTLLNERVLQEIPSLDKNGGITEALSFLKENEKGNFIFPYSKLENTYRTKLNNIKLKDSSDFVHQLRIDKIFSKKEYSMNKKQFLSWIKKTNNLNYQSFENHLIQKFIKNESVQFKHSESGLYFKIINNNQGEKIKTGDAVQLKYTGGPLIKNGEYVDEIIEQEFYVGQELQVIKAMEEVLMYLCKGDSAVIVAPSHLAFGDKGSSTGIIPPYSPVVYYLKVK